MMKRSAKTAIAAGTCTIVLALAGCGGGGGGTSKSAFCTHYLDQPTAGTDPATLREAASYYSRLATEAPDSIKDDLKALAAAETRVLNGDVFSVDAQATDAAASRVDEVANDTCAKK